MLPLLKKTGVCWVPVLFGPGVVEGTAVLPKEAGLEFLEDDGEDEGQLTVSLRMLIRLFVKLGPLA